MLKPVENRITEYLHRKAASERVPLNGTFELTPVCNMACRMCYIRMTQAQQEKVAPLRSAEQWLSLAEECRSRGMLYLLLTGGEPFTHPGWREILSGISRMGLITSVNTNATLIDEAVVEFLKTCPPRRFNITLYGASDKTYAELCGNPVGFTRVDRAITLLKAAGFDIRVNLTVTQYNSPDLEEMVSYCKERNLKMQFSSYMFPPLRRDSTMVGKNDRFTPAQAALWQVRYERFLMGDENFAGYYEAKGIPDFFVEDCLDCTEQGEMRCRAGRCSFWVTWNGRILPCGMFSPESAPDVFETGMAEAWDQVTAFTDAVRLPAKCKSCPAEDSCKACAAICYCETGRFDGVPVYRCDMVRAYPELYKRAVEEIKSHE